MAVQNGEVVLDQQDFLADFETSYDTSQALRGDKPTASDGGPCKVISSTFGVSEPQEFRDDSRQGLADYDTYTMPKEYTWNTEHRIVPVASGDTYCEIHALLLHLFGNYSGGTYSFGTDIQEPDSLQLFRAFNGPNDRLVAEQMNGAFISTMSVRGQGGQPPVIAFSGKAASFARSMLATVATDGGGSNGVIELETNQAAALDPAIAVVIDGDDNSGAGYSFSRSVDSNTIDTGSDDWSSLDGGEIIRPFVPDCSYSGTQIVGATQGNVTLDSVSYPVTQFDLTVDCMPDYREDEFGTESSRGMTRTKMRVTGNLSFRLREDIHTFANRARQNPDVAVVLDLGSSGARRWRLSIDKARFDPAGLQTPAQGIGRVSLPFKALASADGEVDHLTLEVPTP